MMSIEEVKKLIANEVATLKQKVELLEVKFTKLENDVDFYSTKYDELLQEHQTMKKNLSKSKDATNTTINNAKDSISKLEKHIMETAKDLDDLGQYLRRDCVEIVGAQAKTPQECDKIVIAMANDMGLKLEPTDISTSHPLPKPRGKDDKFIVKFSRRSTKDKFCASRKKVTGRKPQDLPSVKNVISTDKKLYISESLTPLRKKLFGETNDTRKQIKWKYIWTNNGKIYIKKDDNSNTIIIDSHNDLIKFQERYNIKK